MSKNKKIISSIIILLAIVLCTGSFVYFNNKKDNKKVTKINNIEDLDKYIKNNCAYNCKYFLLEKKQG